MCSTRRLCRGNTSLHRSAETCADVILGLASKIRGSNSIFQKVCEKTVLHQSRALVCVGFENVMTAWTLTQLREYSLGFTKSVQSTLLHHVVVSKHGHLDRCSLPWFNMVLESSYLDRAAYFATPWRRNPCVWTNEAYFASTFYGTETRVPRPVQCTLLLHIKVAKRGYRDWCSLPRLTVGPKPSCLDRCMPNLIRQGAETRIPGQGQSTSPLHFMVPKPGYPEWCCLLCSSPFCGAETRVRRPAHTTLHHSVVPNPGSADRCNLLFLHHFMVSKPGYLERHNPLRLHFLWRRNPGS